MADIDHEAIVRVHVPDAFVARATDREDDPHVFILAPDETFGSLFEVIGAGKTTREAWFNAWSWQYERC